MQRLYKAFLFSFILGIFIFFIRKLYAEENAYFDWVKTEIDVPLGESIDKYKNKYILDFYVNGRKSNDYEVEMEVNCSTFSTITTNRVGSYRVYYRAISKNHYVYSEIPIIFNVVDIIPPEIILLEDEINFEYGSKASDYNFFKVSDNYSEEEKIIVSFNEQGINYEKLGSYDLIITAVDESGNSSKKKIKISIIDSFSPVITVSNDITIPIDDITQIYDFIEGMDNYDGNITAKIKINTTNQFELGNNYVELELNDSSGNNVKKTCQIFLIDSVMPEIILKETTMILDIKNYSLFNEKFFLNNIKKFWDNYDHNPKVSIDYSQIIQEPGDYEVIYTVSDSSENFSTKYLKVMLRETEPPVINSKENYSFEIGYEVDLLSLVTVTDIYDKDVKNKLEVIDTNLDINKAGDYFVKYRCYNSSGNFIEKEISITINEKTKKDNFSNNQNNLITIFKEQICSIILIILLVFSFGFLIVQIVKFIRAKKLENK